MNAQSWSLRFYYRVAAHVVGDLRNSQYAYARVLRTAVQHARSWLDLGCGHQPLPHWLNEPDRDLPTSPCVRVGIDMDVAALQRHPGPTWRVCGNAETLPFRNGSFDLVTANMVLEHVNEPGLLFREVARVLAPGGQFLVHTPNLYGYTTMPTRLIPGRLRIPLARFLQGRNAADVYPTRYRANSVRSLQTLARGGSLTVVDLRYLNSSPQLIRIPPLLLLELLVLRALAAPAFARYRPCLMVRFRRELESRPNHGRSST